MDSVLRTARIALAYRFGQVKTIELLQERMRVPAFLERHSRGGRESRCIVGQASSLSNNDGPDARPTRTGPRIQPGVTGSPNPPAIPRDRGTKWLAVDQGRTKISEGSSRLRQLDSVQKCICKTMGISGHT